VKNEKDKTLIIQPGATIAMFKDTIKQNISSGIMKIKQKTTQEAKSKTRKHVKNKPFSLPKRSEDGTFQCPSCEKKIKENSNMRRHMQRAHPETVQRSHLKIEFPCPHCDHISNAPYNLTNHINVDHADKMDAL
jgi:uncharacterized C2H2 Zn-finger protein